ncbi:hypothetical protein CASFOL_023937 [Castilleja foliolosa]|uniref:Uncharacterized protein n=1 Tax=Castilleja foliolosa TaxID=1961234 RepID=A0ABD3CLW7_9LAMI
MIQSLDDAEMRNTDNSRWSSRTRAVSKYLQGAFAKEAEECRNKSLSMDSLLTGKSRRGCFSEHWFLKQEITSV